MGVTQQNIADALGLSIITVSRALNNTGYVSKEVKERIFAYAKETKYVPHKASRVLQRNRERRIALFSSTLPAYFWDDIATGARIGADQIRAFGYGVSYRRIPEGDTEAYLAALEDELAQGVEAVAFVNQWIYDMGRIIARLDEAGIPYLTLNVDEPGCRRRCYIGPDYREGGALAAEYLRKLLRLKEDPLALVINTVADIPAGSTSPDINKLRHNGFEAALEKRPGKLRLRTETISSDIESPLAARQLEDIVDRWKDEADAFYLIPAYNGQFIRALEKHRIRGMPAVVHDLDTSSNRYLGEDLLSAVVDQNPILQGYYAVKIMESILEGEGEAAPSTIPVVHSLVMEENRNLCQNHRLFAGMIG